MSRFVNLRYQFTLGNLATFINEEGHDSLWYEVANVLFDDIEVAADKVLNDSSLHDDPCTLLFCTCLHCFWHVFKCDLWEV